MILQPSPPDPERQPWPGVPERGRITGDARHRALLTTVCIQLADLLVERIWHGEARHKHCLKPGCCHRAYQVWQVGHGMTTAGVMMRWRLHTAFPGVRLTASRIEHVQRDLAALDAGTPFWDLLDWRGKPIDSELALSELRQLAVRIGMRTRLPSVTRTRRAMSEVLDCLMLDDDPRRTRRPGRPEAVFGREHLVDVDAQWPQELLAQIKTAVLRWHASGCERPGCRVMSTDSQHGTALVHVWPTSLIWNFRA